MLYFNELTDIFDGFTKKPENYLSVQDKVAADVTNFIKRLYDHTKSEEETLSREALPELIVKDFDEEQIWQELELQNEEKSTKFIRDVAHMVALKNKLVFPIEELVEREGSEDEHGREESESDQSEKLETRKQIPDKDTLNVARKKADHSKKRTKGRSSVVDDQFFKLGDLEKFLDNEDKKEGRLQKKKKTLEGDSSEDSDDTIDYFQDIPSEDESDNENVEAEGNRLHYSDFFDDPDVSDSEHDSGNGGEADDDDNDGNFGGNKETEVNDEDEEMSDSENEDKGYESKKKVRFDFGKSSGSDSENEVSNDEEAKTVEKLKASESKSNFETRQERLKTKISHLEEKSLSDKPWQLKGEVSATTRPQNSLLEEALEFDLTTRPAPVITEETTLKLEDIIRQRIKDKLWDDVERKIKPVETPYEYKKKLTLNQEKSKLSLAQVYEQEYLKQKEAQKPNAEEKPEEEPESHKEIRNMMTALFNKLDALSNFHYTPRAVAPDVQIVSNLPAITIEEVAPVAASDAALLAPEEVKAKSKGDTLGKGERTSTDKKRERRQKKVKQRERQKEKERREKLVEKLRPGLGNKFSKEKALSALERAAKDSNVSLMDGKGKAVKSSSSFFSQLQEEVSTHIKSKVQTGHKRSKENVLSAKSTLLFDGASASTLFSEQCGRRHNVETLVAYSSRQSQSFRRNWPLNKLWKPDRSQTQGALRESYFNMTHLHRHLLRRSVIDNGVKACLNQTID
uniref:U3 small nucleolar ribonucleoprotein protein MPP10 n=1 Tax=Timema tahoe TaxID=61484 RepID=A0A7R9FK06_9NEOP|nr:unnamed protein product [Timema tahoe]